MRILLLLLMPACFLSPGIVNAQPDTLWTQTFGSGYNDHFADVHQTDDGGYILLGSYEHSSSNSDIWLVKTNMVGNMLWEQTYDVHDSEDFGTSLEPTNDGGYIIVGQTCALGSTYSSVYLIKTDAGGIEQWSRVIVRDSCDGGEWAEQTSDGGYIITGYTGPEQSIDKDIWLIKTDANGDTIWTRTFGGDGFERGVCVNQIDNDGYIIFGSTTSFGAGYYDFYLIRTDTNGDTVWTHTYGGAYFEEGEAMQRTRDGGFILAGYIQDGILEDDDFFVVKTDASGNEVWQQRYGSETDQESACCVIQTHDAGYILGGFTYSYTTSISDAYLVRTDNLGNELWQVILNPSDSDCFRAVQQTHDGGYILAGSLRGGDPGGWQHLDGWLVKLEVDPVSGIEPASDYRPVFMNDLANAHPNPFNPSTSLSYKLQVASHINLAVYDIRGRKVAELVDGWRGAGLHEVMFDGSELTSGIYFCRMTAGEFSGVGKMVLLK